MIADIDQCRSIGHIGLRTAISGLAASWRTGSDSIVMDGPKLPFTQVLDATAQLPRSGHSSRCAAFCYAR
jgi:hypothetical protein